MVYSRNSKNLTNAQLTELIKRSLRRRYATRNKHGLPRYIAAPEVPIFCEETLKYRYADFVAVDSHREQLQNSETGKWAFYDAPVHGFEIKTHRSDWLAEYRTGGDKSLAWRGHCHYWWLVAPGPDVIRRDEVPPGWGLMLGTTRLRVAVKPERMEPGNPVDAGLMLSIARYSQRLIETPKTM